MISSRYVRYRNIFWCIYCDICNSIRNAFSRKKKAPPEKAPGYLRWVNLGQGGGMNSGLPSASVKKKEDSEEKSRKS